MAYTPTVWVDNQAPAITAARLNNIETGVDTLDLNNQPTNPGGDRPWYSTDGRFFSPITYWWADYYNTNGNWQQTIALAETMGPAIINISSGSGTAKDTDWTTEVGLIRDRGMKVIGYVRTGYGSRTKTDILAEVANHVTWYGVDGVFLDEVVNGYGGSQTTPVSFYSDLYSTIKATYGQAFRVVINPGSTTTEDVLACGDTVMTFENDAATYLAPSVPIAPDYYAKYPPSKFWHVIHTITSASQAQQVLALARDTYKPGFLCMTDQVMPNPYTVLPAQYLIDMQVGWARRYPSLNGAAPGTVFRCPWNGTAWTYNGTTLTARPTARTDVFLDLYGAKSAASGGPATPSWVATGDSRTDV